MNPEIWGPPLWYEMHTKTFKYPENPTNRDKLYITQYFNEFKNTLPCDKCKVHYRSYLLMRPLQYYVNNKESLVRWLIDLHNQVNSRTGKRILSYEEVKAIYK